MMGDMFSSRGDGRGPGHRKELWERWSTRITVICATLALLAVAFYAQSYVTPENTTWRDKASTLMHEVGIGPEFDKGPDRRLHR
jgi:hypothetical protein